VYIISQTSMYDAKLVFIYQKNNFLQQFIAYQYKKKYSNVFEYYTKHQHTFVSIL